MKKAIEAKLYDCINNGFFNQYEAVAIFALFLFCERLFEERPDIKQQFLIQYGTATYEHFLDLINGKFP
jgi:hypothetical protein